jgi:ferredoxin-NADP reductase
VWGAISYEGPGYFIAGGAGITPFLAILRQLQRNNALAGNALFFANKTSQDIILKVELKAMLGDHAVFVLSGEKDAPGCVNGFIDEGFLSTHVDDFSKHFYVCGPPPMMTAVNGTLEKLGASPEALVFEK